MCNMFTTFLCIHLMLISIHMSAGEVAANNYHKMVINKVCVPILACNLHQLSARSKIQCAIFVKSLKVSVYHYASSTGTCNICMPDSQATSFTKIESDLNYFIEGTYQSFYGLNQNMILVICLDRKDILFMRPLSTEVYSTEIMYS